MNLSPSAFAFSGAFVAPISRNRQSPSDLGFSLIASLPNPDFCMMEEEFKMLKWSLWKAKVDEKLMVFLTKQWYVGMLARVRINAFRIELVATLHEDLLASAVASVACEAAVGNAVYMLPSFYNHDCDPNTHIVWIDCATAKLKALRQIE